jgi:hypothetical protein
MFIYCGPRRLAIRRNPALDKLRRHSGEVPAGAQGGCDTVFFAWRRWVREQPLSPRTDGERSRFGRSHQPRFAPLWVAGGCDTVFFA